MSKKDLKKAVYRLRELEAQAGEIAQEIDMLKDAIKAEMTAQNVTEMQVDVFRIRWASVLCRTCTAASFGRQRRAGSRYNEKSPCKAPVKRCKGKSR